MDGERSIADRLAELQQLHDDGLITDDEFAERRSAILDELSAAPSPPPAPVSPTTSKSGTPARRTAGKADLYKKKNKKKKPKKNAPAGMGCLVFIAIIVIGGWAVSSLFGSTSGGTSGGTLGRAATNITSAASEDDAGAKLACRHFRNVAGDATAGVLTDSELRQKLKEVNDSAKVSEVRSVRLASLAMLSAATSGSSGSLGSAVSSMDSACKSVGF